MDKATEIVQRRDPEHVRRCVFIIIMRDKKILTMLRDSHPSGWQNQKFEGTLC